MKTYEYQRFLFTAVAYDGPDIDALNRLGAQGWRLVSHHLNEVGWWVGLFVREVTLDTIWEKGIPEEAMR